MPRLSVNRLNVDCFTPKCSHFPLNKKNISIKTSRGMDKDPHKLVASARLTFGCLKDKE